MSTSVAEKPVKRPTYGAREVEKALIVMAECNGDTGMAARALEASGLKINPATLWKWRTNQHKERYQEIRAEVMPRVTAEAAEEYKQLAALQIEASRQMTERLMREIPDVPTRDLPGGTRNMTVAAATSTDKAQLLSGQPTERKEQSMPELLRELRAALPRLSEAVVVDVEVIEEEDVGS